MNLNNFIGAGAYWSVNKAITKKAGINAAILLSDLISKRQYFIENKDIKLGDWFFNTTKNIELDTTLTKHQQALAIKNLVNEGFLITDRKSVGGKRRFIIVDSVILSVISEYEDSQKLKKRSLEVKKTDSRNQKSGVSYNKNKEQKQKRKINTTNSTDFSVIFLGFCARLDSGQRIKVDEVPEPIREQLINKYSTSGDYIQQLPF